MMKAKSYPEPPYPRGSAGNNNAKRTGWIAFHEGSERGACPFPRAMPELNRAYVEGWDAAQANLHVFRAAHPPFQDGTPEHPFLADTFKILGETDQVDFSPAVDYPPGIKLPEDQGELVRYAALGRAAEQHGLAWYAPDGKRGEMLFQPPAEMIAEQALREFINGNNLTKMSTEPAKAAPVPMLLHCPGCGERHIDEGDFATKPHHTHACQGCGMVWRPAIVDTVGVKFLPGFKNDVRP